MAIINARSSQWNDINILCIYNVGIYYIFHNTIIKGVDMKYSLYGL